MTEIRKIGRCKFCGNRKVKEVKTLNSGDMKLLIKWKLNDFIHKFERTKGVDDD